MSIERDNHSIEFVKEQVINTSLVVSSILGGTAYIVSYISRYYTGVFNISVIFETLVLVSLLVLAFRRKVLSNSTKAYLMVFLLLFISLTDAFFYGLISATRIYIVLVPLYAIIYLPFLRSVVIYLIAILGFVLIGYFHSQGVLSLPEGYEPNSYILRLSPWIINALHIVAVGLVILYVTRKFFFAFTELVGHLQNQNQIISDNERNYKEIFNSTTEAIFIHNETDGRILDVNDVMLGLFGLESKEQALGFSVKDISAQNDSKTELRAQELMRKAVEEGPQVFEWLSRKRNGEVFASEISLRSTEIGGKGRVLAVLRDISERKKAEQSLRESEARYRTIIEAFPEIIMVSDLDGKIVFANSVLEKVTGITPADYSNPQRKPAVHPDDSEYLKSEISKLITGLEIHTPILENRFIDANGKIHWLSGIISKIYIDGKLYLQTISRDITDKKNIEEQLARYRNHLEQLVQERTEELEATNEELSAANDELMSQREELESILNKLQTTQKQLIQSEKMASIGILAAGIAHEINNPLNFITGGTEAIKSYISEKYELTAEISELIGMVNEGIKRASNIVSGLNHYSRRNDKVYVKSNLHNIIDNCIVLLSNETKNIITIEKRYTNEPFEMDCNEGKIHQAILNILTNAVQSISKQGTLDIETYKADKELHIIITDSGSGIAPENISKIFDPFFTTKDPGKGTGLGLFITHAIIEEHGGRIGFDSQPGKGTRVTLVFPSK